jgi:hypothetical protein
MRFRADSNPPIAKRRRVFKKQMLFANEKRLSIGQESLSFFILCNLLFAFFAIFQEISIVRETGQWSLPITSL